ncbi:hypothetical protein L1887_38721 [Cichorium endivia]|nr:hypothetical protein L1887_38721 [Cichorium endivia]
MAFDQSLIHLRPRPLCQAPDVDPPLYFCRCISASPLMPPSYAPDDAASATFPPLGLLNQHSSGRGVGINHVIFLADNCVHKATVLYPEGYRREMD